VRKVLKIAVRLLRIRKASRVPRARPRREPTVAWVETVLAALRRASRSDCWRLLFRKLLGGLRFSCVGWWQGHSYSCFMCSSARRASSGPMVFLVIAKDSELMVAAFEWLSCVCLFACYRFVARRLKGGSNQSRVVRKRKAVNLVNVGGRFEQTSHRTNKYISPPPWNKHLEPFPRSSSPRHLQFSRCTGRLVTRAP
jgi:hypothetical protein